MRKVFIFILVLSAFMMQACSKSKDSDEPVTVDSSLPFPPIDNYETLDEELKPPSLTK